MFVFCSLYVVVFFFFKQKTAYEMRISDWSSDVCSSDLGLPKMPFRAGETFPRRERRDLVLPRESSTKIIEMVQCARNRPFGPHPANHYGSSLSLLFANSDRVEQQTTTFCRT